MRLLLAAKVLRVEEIEEAAKAPEVAAALTRAAMEFVHAGGVVTLDEWSHLLPCERAAMLAARVAYDARKAVDAARALFDPAAVGAPADGGEARGEAKIDTVLARVVAEARSAPARDWNGKP